MSSLVARMASAETRPLTSSLDVVIAARDGKEISLMTGPMFIGGKTVESPYQAEIDATNRKDLFGEIS